MHFALFQLCFLIGWLNQVYLLTSLYYQGFQKASTFYMRLQVSTKQFEIHNLQRVAIRNLSPPPTDILQRTYMEKIRQSWRTLLIYKNYNTLQTETITGMTGYQLT